MPSEGKKKPKSKRIVNGYVSHEIADCIGERAAALDFTVTKYASHILQDWYTCGAQPVHPLEKGFFAGDVMSTAINRVLNDPKRQKILMKRAAAIGVEPEEYLELLFKYMIMKDDEIFDKEYLEKKVPEVDFSTRDETPDLPGDEKTTRFSAAAPSKGNLDLNEDKASYPSAAEQIEAFTGGDKTEQRNVSALLTLLKKKPEAYKQLSLIMDALEDITKSGELPGGKDSA